MTGAVVGSVVALNGPSMGVLPWWAQIALGCVFAVAAWRLWPRG